MKKLIVLVAAALSLNAMALTIDMNLTMNDKTKLTGKSDTLFVRAQSVVSGNFAITVTDDGETQSVSQEIPPQGNFDPSFSIEVLNGDKVRLIDSEENIDQVVPAKVKKTMFGNLKTVKISKETLKLIYAEALERDGLTLLSSFGLETDEITLKTSFDFSDLVCALDKGTGNLDCDQSAALNIHAND
ncbi:MAG: hypothetical protein KC493_12380 [Bacteriovoracaceae bacterium]|nr:hypothetical protein [Bacteriovoracaceae bacterium]